MSKFDPATVLRGEQSSSEGDDKDDGIGLDEKGQAHMLRLLTSKQGWQWLSYSTISGGMQSEDGTWFEFYCNGIINVGGKQVLGDWLIKVTGKGLEMVGMKVAKGVRSLLKVGRTTNSLQPIAVQSIIIEPMELEGQDD
jgi:hypothetical protein